MLARAVITVLTFYQRTFSPDHGWFAARHPYGWCKFYPSCSEYTKQAIMKYGVFPALVLSAWRVARCHPWQKPSIDPVP